MAAGSARAHRSSEVESPRRSCPGSHTAADAAAAFAMLPSTAATHREHAQGPCTRNARKRQVDIEQRCDPDEAVCDLGASSESNVRNFTLKTMGYDAVNDSQQARGAKPVSSGRIWKSMRPQFLPKAQ